MRAAGFGGAENDPVSILAPERHHHDGDGWQSFEWDLSEFSGLNGATILDIIFYGALPESQAILSELEVL